VDKQSPKSKLKSAENSRQRMFAAIHFGMLPSAVGNRCNRTRKSAGLLYEVAQPCSLLAAVHECCFRKVQNE
jgi:hypothetical protein